MSMLEWVMVLSILALMVIFSKWMMDHAKTRRRRREYRAALRRQYYEARTSDLAIITQYGISTDKWHALSNAERQAFRDRFFREHGL